MKGLRSFLGFLVVIAIIGGGAFAIYHFAIQGKVKDQTPAQRAACNVEKAMVKESINAAVKQRVSTGLDMIDPSTYIDKSVTLKYYNWAPGGMTWVLQPIGTPPC